jgi:uncharacterized protein (TIGR02118 family)
MTGPIFKDSKTENTVTLSLQVLYTTENGTTFDHAYYTSKHLPIVTEHMCSHIQEILIIKGLAGGPDTPSGYHVIATMTFADKAALDSAMAAAGPALKDIPNFYTGEPKKLVAEVTQQRRPNHCLAEAFYYTKGVGQIQVVLPWPVSVASRRFG